MNVTLMFRYETLLTRLQMHYYRPYSDRTPDSKSSAFRNALRYNKMLYRWVSI
jgi:hypothetical protein